MSYKEEICEFTRNYPYQQKSVGNAEFRYVLAGEEGRPTLVLLNGGMNTSEMWLRYVGELSKDYMVLIFDYPRQLKTNQALVTGMADFFSELGIQKPILVGASDGGMVAQIYTQKYPDKVGGLVLISTGGMDAATLKTLKRKYFFGPIMLFYMKHCNYEKLKPKFIKMSLRHVKDESDTEKAYARDMFETIFADYTKEKDVHITGLLIDLMKQIPVTKATFIGLKGRILLILPDKDWFSEKMQKDLMELMYDPTVHYVKGGHLSTVLRAEDYIREIRVFLDRIFC